MKFNIREYNKIRWLKIEQINKMNKEELLSTTKKAVQFAKNRQDKMLKYMKDMDIDTTPAMKSPYITHKQPNSKLGREEGEFKGFQTYDFELKENMKNNTNYLRYKLNTAIRYLKSKTSTKRGWEKLMENFGNRLKKYFPNLDVDTDFLSKRDRYDVLFRVYREVSKHNPAEISSNLSSNELQKLIYETMEENKSITKVEDLVDLVNEKYDEKYNEKLKTESTDLDLGTIKVGTKSNVFKSDKV